MSRFLLRCIAVLVAAGAGLGPLYAGSSTRWEVVVTGLDNPRGLAIGPRGVLYIAEAGRGGDGPCGPGPEGIRCYGPTGAIARFNPRTRAVEQIATGLPSLATEGEGAFATGPHDISLNGRENAYFTIGFGGDPRTRETVFGPQGRKLARAGRLKAHGDWDLIADIGDYEAANNPTGDEIDTNPYGILALSRRQVVTDAGGNSLLEIDRHGGISALATFANRMVDAPPFLGLPPGTQIPMDAVPTTVALGPKSGYFVGQLTGFPFPVGGANVYRVPRHGGTPTVYASGFTAIIDIAFGDDGSLYVLEIAKNGLLAAFNGNDWTGALIRVRPNGRRTEIVPGVLSAPGGLAIGHDGALYVTNNSIYSGIGEVLKIRP